VKVNSQMRHQKFWKGIFFTFATLLQSQLILVGIHVQEGGNYPSKIKTWPPMGCGPIHLKWLGLDSFEVFETNSIVKSTTNKNLWAAYYFRAFTLKLCEVRLYAINSPFSRPRVFDLSKVSTPRMETVNPTFTSPLIFLTYRTSVQGD
jgi:hypothetical protein